MKRSELEHIIRAASAVTNHPDIVVIGSQALLAQFPDAPEELLTSIEADVFPKRRPDLSIQIDGAIGERSLFHETFGYYAHGVDDTTATLPAGWADRLVPIRNENTGGATGWCLKVHDLAASKLYAGRDKDMHFVRVRVRRRMVKPDILKARLDAMPVDPDQHELLRKRFDRLLNE
ncbi:MAG: hypothetical protein NZ739_10210 [Verrucomicrobiae bacterium]|nr:hypothetical protein [Verrucomicrobiae bacterium]